MTIKIEVGKTYVDEDGNAYGPMVIWCDETDYMFSTKPGMELAPAFRADGVGKFNGKRILLVGEAPAPLALEAGKFYVTRGGETVGPLVATPSFDRFYTQEFKSNIHDCRQVWESDGSVYEESEGEGVQTLVAEAPLERVDIPERAPDQHLALEEGKHYRLANGSVVGPMVETAADHFHVEGVKSVVTGGQQFWNPDGTVWGFTAGEEGQRVVEEVEPVPAIVTGGQKVCNVQTVEFTVQMHPAWQEMLDRVQAELHTLNEATEEVMGRQDVQIEALKEELRSCSEALRGSNAHVLHLQGHITSLEVVIDALREELRDAESATESVKDAFGIAYQDFKKSKAKEIETAVLYEQICGELHQHKNATRDYVATAKRYQQRLEDTITSMRFHAVAAGSAGLALGVFLLKFVGPALGIPL